MAVLALSELIHLFAATIVLSLSEAGVEAGPLCIVDRTAVTGVFASCTCMSCNQ